MRLAGRIEYSSRENADRGVGGGDRTRRFVVAVSTLLAMCATGMAQPGPSEKDIADAYVYLLARALVIR